MMTECIEKRWRPAVSSEEALTSREPLTNRKGIGQRAPAQLLYEIKPEYDSFVARAGVDEWPLQMDSGRGRAMYPSVLSASSSTGNRSPRAP